MGLEISIVETSGVNLEELYAVYDAICEMDWYLGDDRESRGERWTELRNKCANLTKEQVLAEVDTSLKEARFIEGLDDTQFKTYLGMLVDSISPHANGNTHLHFDCDKFPEKDLWFSCSGNLHSLLMECMVDNGFGPCGDCVVELDKGKVKQLASRWRRKKTKIAIAKWVGYFLPNAGERILQDCIMELGLPDKYIEVHDLEYYYGRLIETGEAIDKSGDKDDRFWMISSY